MHFLGESSTVTIPTSDQCQKSTDSLKGTENVSIPMAMTTQQYEVYDLFWFSVSMDCDNFVFFQIYLSLSKKVRNRCIAKRVFSY